MLMKPPWAGRWSPVGLLLTAALLSSAWGLQRCDAPRAFPVRGRRPVSMAHGQNLTMVALLTSTCSFCISQARRMHNLSRELQRSNRINVRMMIVNGVPHGRGVFENIVDFDVFYDNRDLYIWNQVFGGAKDDIFVFNRCGKLLYRIPFPYSYLGYRYVTRALRLASNDPDMCPCEEEDPHDTMMADGPQQGQNLFRPDPRSARYRKRVSRFRPAVRRRRLCARGDGACRARRRGHRRSKRSLDPHNTMMADRPKFQVSTVRHGAASKMVRHRPPHRRRRPCPRGRRACRAWLHGNGRAKRSLDRHDMMTAGRPQLRASSVRHRPVLSGPEFSVRHRPGLASVRHRRPLRRRRPCRRGDDVCRALRRGQRRYNRFLRHRGLSRRSQINEEEMLRLFQHEQSHMASTA